MDKIEELRQLIDVLDDEIMNLLDQRFTLSTKIGNAKTHAKIAVLDPKRENTILEKALKCSHSPEVGVVYKKIMEASKLLQRK